MTADEERRLTLLEMQVGALIKQREDYAERVQKLRAFIDENCSHSVHVSSEQSLSGYRYPCRVCQFLKEDGE